jgi:hypothetical protein
MTVRWSALRRRGLLHLVAGPLAGLVGAVSLFRMGVITLSSPMWIYLPLVTSTLWVALGTTASHQRAVSAAARGDITPVHQHRSAPTRGNPSTGWHPESALDETSGA